MSFALGIVSALVAPFLVVLGFIVWENHWSGSAFALNMYKCNLTAMGFAIVSITLRYVSGCAFSADVFTPTKVGALMLSSTIGIIIGDWTWLEGMRMMGTRKIIAVDSLKPFLAGLLGEIFLDEKLQLGAYVGLILTMVGVSLVGLEKEAHQHDESLSEDSENAQEAHESDSLLVSEKSKREQPAKADSYAEKRRNRKKSNGETVYGLIMATMNVVLHTCGALLTKKYGIGMSTFEINFIRFGFAGLCMVLLSVSMSLPSIWTKVMKQGGGSVPSAGVKPWYLLPDAPIAFWMRISLGVAFVSFLVPALTNYAMFQISLALLLTLESIGPLYSLPLSYLLQDDRPTLRACFGAILAVAGIIILSFTANRED